MRTCMQRQCCVYAYHMMRYLAIKTDGKSTPSWILNSLDTNRLVTRELAKTSAHDSNIKQVR